MTSSFLYGTFRANKRVCSDMDRFCLDLDHFAQLIIGCTIRYPKIDNLRYSMVVNYPGDQGFLYMIIMKLYIHGVEGIIFSVLGF